MPSFLAPKFGQIFTDQIEVTIRHHAQEFACFVVNATGWLSLEQVEQITTDEKLQRVLSGGCMTATIGPESNHLSLPITKGEGMAIALRKFFSNHQAQANDRLCWSLCPS